MSKKTTLFTDIGGVFLTNGWDHNSRLAAIKHFKLDEKPFNERHALTFDLYQTGKISLDSYLERVVFYQHPHFSREEFKEFMFKQSQPYPEMITLFKKLKEKHKIKIVAISNEGRDLADYRTEIFKLKEWIDIFVYSYTLGLVKPDEKMFTAALELAQVRPDEGIYIDDRPLLAEVAASVGLYAIAHSDIAQTEALLNQLFV